MSAPSGAGTRPILVGSLRAFPRGLPRPVLTFGNFDGVHRGHQALLAEIVRVAVQTGGTSVAMTFRPHPVTVLQPERAPPLITDYDAKVRLLAASGVDVVFEVPFDREFAEWTAEHFAMDLLGGIVGVSHVLLGPDSHFGRNRTGDVAMMRRYGALAGFTVDALDAVRVGDDVVSSSLVRRVVSEYGDMPRAARLLGRPFSLAGIVVRGFQRGRTIGFPTANLQPTAALLPRFGVYAAWVVRGAARLPAVVNIGKKPTFGVDHPATVEAHILDFDGDLYGEPIALELVERIRDEQRFEGVGELVAQIARDAQSARQTLAAA